MLKLKKMIIVAMIIVVAGLLGTATVEATIDISDSLQITDPTTPNLNTENTTNTVNEVNEQTTNTQEVQPNLNQVNNNLLENTLPKTGVTEDITVMFFIIVCAISAIYAYRKIRDYNV